MPIPAQHGERWIVVDPKDLPGDELVQSLDEIGRGEPGLQPALEWLGELELAGSQVGFAVALALPAFGVLPLLLAVAHSWPRSDEASSYYAVGAAVVRLGYSAEFDLLPCCGSR